MMAEVLEKYKNVYKKKKQIDFIQESLMEQFKIPKRTAKCIHKGVTENSSHDDRSVHVTNVHYDCSLNDLSEHFKDCGEILRATIPKNRTGGSKGYAFVEFKANEAAGKALLKSGSMLKSRELTVTKKRKNIPGLASGRSRGRILRRRGRGGHKLSGRGGHSRGRLGGRVGRRFNRMRLRR